VAKFTGEEIRSKKDIIYHIIFQILKIRSPRKLWKYLHLQPCEPA